MARRVSGKAIGLGAVGIGVVVFALVYFVSDRGGDKRAASDSGITESKQPVAKSPAVTKSPPSEQETKRPEEDAGPAPSFKRMDLAQVEAALDDPELTKRMEAIWSLRENPSPEAVALLARFLNDPERVVVSEAIDTLGFIGLNSVNEVLKGQVLDVLLERAQDKAFVQRGDALIAGAMLGGNDRTFQLIGEYIAEEGDRGTGFAVRALSFLAGPDTVPYLSEILSKTKDPDISKNTFALLARIGTPEAMALVTEQLSSKMEANQVSSAWALSRKNDYDSNAVLLEAVGGNQLSEAALGVIAASPAASAVFGEVLNQNIAKEDKLYFLDVLSLYSLNAPGDVRNQVAEAIKPLMKSTDADIRVAAIEAVGKVGAKEDHSEALAEHFDDNSFLVRGAALQSFMQYCSPSTYKPLIKLWDDEDEKIRRTAFFFAEIFMNQSDLDALEKATAHSDEFIAKHSKLMIKHLTQVQ